jgi:hypothetical protein
MWMMFGLIGRYQIIAYVISIENYFYYRCVLNLNSVEYGTKWNVRSLSVEYGTKWNVRSLKKLNL